MTFRRESRFLIDAAQYAAMHGLLGYLKDHCCQGEPEAFGLTVCDPVAAVAPAIGRARDRSVLEDAARSRAKRA